MQNEKVMVATILAAIQSAALRRSAGRDILISDLASFARTIMFGAEVEVQSAWVEAQRRIGEDR